MDAIKIAILEDLKEVAEHLKEIFNQEEDMNCTQVYVNAEDAMHFLPANPVDILIVDIGLPRASGIDAIKFLNEHCPGIQYCMFTVYEDDDKIFNSLQAGGISAQTDPLFPQQIDPLKLTSYFTLFQA